LSNSSKETLFFDEGSFNKPDIRFYTDFWIFHIDLQDTGILFSLQSPIIP